MTTVEVERTVDEEEALDEEGLQEEEEGEGEVLLDPP